MRLFPESYRPRRVDSSRSLLTARSFVWAVEAAGPPGCLRVVTFAPGEDDEGLDVLASAPTVPDPPQPLTGPPAPRQGPSGACPGGASAAPSRRPRPAPCGACPCPSVDVPPAP